MYINTRFKGFIVCAVALLCFISVGGNALAASGSVGGAALPIPSVTQPTLNEEYQVTLRLFNTSVSNEPFPNQGLGIEVDVASATLTLACADSNCNTELGGAITFINTGGNGCVSNNPCVTSCSASGNNQVVFTLNNCSIGPNGNIDLATIHVRQDATPPSIVMRGEGDYLGTAGTCVSGFCDNAESGHTCEDNSGCDYSLLQGSGTGTANITPQQQTHNEVVPTMTEWGMFIFMVFAGIGSLYFIRKKGKV